MWILAAVHRSTDDMCIGLILYLIEEDDEKDG
jgi:hypothetical protein